MSTFKFNSESEEGDEAVISTKIGGAPTDTEMLDWLEKQGDYYGWTVQLEKDRPHVSGAVFLCRNSTGGRPTARAAIAERMGYTQ